MVELEEEVEDETGEDAVVVGWAVVGVVKEMGGRGRDLRCHIRIRRHVFGWCWHISLHCMLFGYRSIRSRSHCLCYSISRSCRVVHFLENMMMITKITVSGSRYLLKRARAHLRLFGIPKEYHCECDTRENS